MKIYKYQINDIVNKEKGNKEIKENKNNNPGISKKEETKEYISIQG